MERAPLTQERVITPDERERLNSALASYGLYDASLETYQVTEHPEDDQWIIKSEN